MQTIKKFPSLTSQTPFKSTNGLSIKHHMAYIYCTQVLYHITQYPSCIMLDCYSIQHRQHMANQYSIHKLGHSCFFFSFTYRSQRQTKAATKECRAFSFNMCLFPVRATIGTIASPHPYQNFFSKRSAFAGRHVWLFFFWSFFTCLPGRFRGV